MVQDSNRPALSQSALMKLLEVTRKLAAPYDLTTMLTEVVEAGRSALNADLATLWLYDAECHELEIRVPQLEPSARVAAGQGLVGECLAARKIINVPDCASDKRFMGAVDRATGYETQSVLNIPLVSGDDPPVGVMQLHNKIDGEFDQNDELLAAAVAAQCAVALQRTRLTEALIVKERLDEEVHLARELQISTLPEIMPSVPNYDVHGHFLPTEYAGGDLFDLVMLGDQLFMLLGDATGHGFGPALSATQMQAMLRVAFRLGADLDQAYRHVNNQLAEDLPDDRFITAFMGFLDPINHQVQFHSGGQGPILHYHADSGLCEWHKPTNYPVGIMEIDTLDKARSLDLEPGDILGLISDGVYEYHNPAGDQFGEQGVADLIARHHKLSMAELTERLVRAAFDFGNGVSQADDITVVLVRREAA